MSVTFPTTLDALTNPISTNPLNNPSQSAQHADENDAIEALEAKVGVNSSAVNTSIDYLLKSTSSSNPGHKHTLADGATDLTKASGAEINTGTDDAKFATAKAIADSNVSFPAKTETQINKTFTSPKINEDVALTATATQLNALAAGGVTTRLASKLVLKYRDQTAATGDVAYTGVGFQPTSIIFMTTGEAVVSPLSIGFSDSSRAVGLLGKYTNNVNSAPFSGTVIIGATGTDNSNLQTASVKSYDADGFTLAWTKTGSPSAGTLNIWCLCFR